MQLPKTYPYRPKVLQFLLAGLLFGLAAAFFIYLAISNEQGLILNGFISMGKTGATIFYSVLALLSLGFVGIALFTMYRAKSQDRLLVLKEDMFLCPKSGVSSKIMKVLYRDISSLEEQTVNGQTFLNIQCSEGKFSIVRMMLGKEAYQEVKEELISQIEASRANT